MNLNYHTTDTEFREFVDSADRTLDTHSVVIDYDGEVIIDPEKYFPSVPTARYKFCTKVKDISLRSLDMVRALHTSLQSIFEDDFRNMDNGPMTMAA